MIERELPRQWVLVCRSSGTAERTLRETGFVKIKNIYGDAYEIKINIHLRPRSSLIKHNFRKLLKDILVVLNKNFRMRCSLPKGNHRTLKTTPLGKTLNKGEMENYLIELERKSKRNYEKEWRKRKWQKKRKQQ